MLESFAAADANLIAALRAPARWQGECAEARQDGGLLLVAGVRRFLNMSQNGASPSSPSKAR